MIEPDTRLDHLMAAAFAKWGTAAVLEQVFVHVTWNKRFAPPLIHEEVTEAGRKLMEALATIHKWEAMHAVEDKTDAE